MLGKLSEIGFIFFISLFWISCHSRTWRMSLNIVEVNCFWQFLMTLVPIPCLKPCHFLFVIKCRYSCFSLQKSDYSKWKRQYDKSIFSVIILLFSWNAYRCNNSGKLFRFESTLFFIVRTLSKILLLACGKDYFSSLRFQERIRSCGFFSFNVSLITLLTFNVI